MSYNILFIHQHFPGQFKHIGPALAKDNNVHSLSMFDYNVEGVQNHKWTPKRGNGDNVHPLALEFETKVLRAEGCADKARELKNDGFTPDLVIGHTGWGELMYIKEVWPETKLLSYVEFHYNLINSDIDFDLEEQEGMDTTFLRRKLIGRNAVFFSQYENSDYLFSPTNFQKSTFPEHWQKKISVIHEGIDTDRFVPKPEAKFNITVDDLKKSIELSKESKVVLFVNRNLEPYRGYHIFMRSLEHIFKQHPDAYIIIVGGDETSYGKKPPKGQKWRKIFYNEVKDKIDSSRVIFTGYLPDHNALTSLMQVSTVQVYLTYPFVLSWSLLESLSCGLTVIASNTGPVNEVITDEQEGLLVDFFDHKGIAERVNKVLNDPVKFSYLGKNARNKMIKEYDLDTVCLPKTLKFIKEILEE